MTRRLLALAVLGGVTLVATPLRGQPPLPMTGPAPRATRPLDDLVLAFLEEHDVPGAALAVVRDGRLVHARGYGHADVERGVPVEPTSLFRIASVSKPVTAAAVLKLVERGRIGLDDRVVGLLLPAGRLVRDPRLSDVRLEHLLQHSAGWDREETGDPLAARAEVAAALRLRRPPRGSDALRYALARPLQFSPGERQAYANVGYTALGVIVEKLAGESYESFVRREVLAPLGIRRMRVGSPSMDGALAGEVTYYERKAGGLEPVRALATTWDPPSGGWVASVVDLARFAAAFADPASCPILREDLVAAMAAVPEEPCIPKMTRNVQRYAGLGWQVHRRGPGRDYNLWHAGWLAPGTSAEAAVTPEVTWVVLFNTDVAENGKPLADLFDARIYGALDRVERWPEHDLFGAFEEAEGVSSTTVGSRASRPVMQ